MRPVLLSLPVALSPATAAACPLCEGDPSIGNPTRAELFGTSFWPHLLAVAAPFALVLVALAVASRRRPRP